MLTALPAPDQLSQKYAEAVVAAAKRISAAKGKDPWGAQRRPSQIPPDWAWRHWLIMAGRGFGKTRTGAEWVREEVMHHGARRVALVAATAADYRDVMVEGESGILEVCDRYGIAVKWEPSKRKLTFPNGAIAKCYSAEKPNRLRGPQHDRYWADEPAAWDNALDTWDNLQFGLRLGTNPRGVLTTTPKPVPIVRTILAQKRTDARPNGTVAVTTGTTYENVDNLAPAFKDEILGRYEGTRLGRQELLGELLEDTPGALWRYAMLEATRVAFPPPFLQRIVIGVDPKTGTPEDRPGLEDQPGSETGIIAVGIDSLGEGYVLEDASIDGTPLEWATAVVNTYRKWQADRIVAEANQGGAMVESTLRQVDPNLPITLVHASRGKLTRAEPVAAKYEQRKMHHVGAYPRLESQMTTYDGSGDSPDRMDALVWATTDLMIRESTEVREDNYLADNDEEAA